MRSNLIKTLLAVLVTLSTAKLQAQDPSLYIFLCFGQSNMEGQGTIESMDRTVDERFQVFQALDCSNLNREKGNWYPAIPPLTRCWTRLSPADYFGRTMIENLPDHIKVGIINVSIGGSRIELFDKDIYESYTNTYTEDWFQNAINEYDRNPYQYLIDLAKDAKKDGIIKGILLHQGESNNNDSQWPNKVKKIYDHMIEDLNLDPSKTPLLAGEMVHEDQGGILAGMNAIINQLPDELDNSYVISSSSCSDQDDNIHFDAAGYRELGKRYAAKMLEVMDNSSLVLEEKTFISNTVSEIFPNPTSGLATIAFSVSEPSAVTIELIDFSGKVIDTIANKDFNQGNHVATYDFSRLTSGVYFYTVKVGNTIHTDKIMVQQ